MCCDMTHSYAATWLIRTSRYDSFMHSYMPALPLCLLSSWFSSPTLRTAALLCDMHMCDMHMCDMHMCDMTHSCVWCDSSVCVTWLLHVCDTRIYMLCWWMGVTNTYSVWQIHILSQIHIQPYKYICSHDPSHIWCIHDHQHTNIVWCHTYENVMSRIHGCESRPIHQQVMTPPLASHDPSISDSWLPRQWVTTHSSVSHDTSIDIRVCMLMASWRARTLINLEISRFCCGYCATSQRSTGLRYGVASVSRID